MSQVNKKKGVISFVFCLFFLVCNASALDIDQKWLDDHGLAPYYLDTAGETYVLQTDVNTEGTAFVLLNHDITFDLGGHIVTFGDSLPVVVPNGDFEESGGWSFGTAPNAERAQGTFVQPVSVYSGSYALKFQMPVPNQSIRTLESVTLEPNTTYTISAKFYSIDYYNNPGVENVKVYVKLDGTSIETSQTGITWRGFQHRSVKFATGQTPETYFLVAGIEGATAKGAVYIDDVRIQKYMHHGIVAGIAGWQANLAPDVKRTGGNGSASGAILRNGTVRQGRAFGEESHGVFFAALNRNIEVANMNITVQGANSINILVHENCHGIRLHDNTLTSDVKTITSRDNGDGIMIHVVQGASGVEIFNNTLMGGPQGGISLARTTDISKIHGNTIYLKTRYSNGFGIISHDAEVYNNTINCHEGDYSCRGMYVSDNSNVHNNIVHARELPRNQEYDGCCLGGAYGVQLEGGLNIDFYDNTVSAYSNECVAAAFRTNEPWQGVDGKPWGDMRVKNNRFVAVQQGPEPSYSFKADTIQEPEAKLKFENNILETNSRWIIGYDFKNQLFRSNTFVLNQKYGGPFLPFIDEGNESDIRFIDNRYDSLQTKQDFVNSFFTNSRGNPSATASYYLGWYLTVITQNGASPLPNTSVSVFDKGNNQVFAGQTDASGSVVATLDEFKMASNVKNIFGPFLVQVTAAGFGTRQRQITLDRSKLVVFNFGADQPPRVDAGENQAVTLSAGAYLHGTFIDEEDPQKVAWSQVSGPEGALLQTPDQLDTKVTFAAVGTYVFQLVGQDTAGNEAAGEVSIQVVEDFSSNYPPSLFAGNDRTILYGTPLSLDAQVTDDGLPDPPKLLTYRWEMVFGPGAAVFEPPDKEDTTVQFSVFGYYRLRLTVSDGQLSMSDSLDVLVNAAGPGQELGNIGKIINFIHPNGPKEIVINLTLSPGIPVQAKIFDRQRNLVKVLGEESLSRGSGQMRWDGRNADGDPVVSGTYFLIGTVGNTEFKEKLAVVR
ncbi:MAG: hypothetical protein LHV69_03555 [Elusimicrobia bacterium]|nr:hypothetical protein [Candidatus Obscuribacterium magneticum]